MTAIVGLEHEGKITIGGDAAAVAGDQVTVRSDAKVFADGEYLIGFAGSYRLGQLIRYALDLRPQFGGDDLEHLVLAFAEPLRQLLIAHGATKEDEGEECAPGSLLIGYRGQLYAMDSDFHVGRAACGYEAIGDGAPYALGSMASTFGSPFARVHTALAAAQRHCTAVRQPFTILTSP